MVLVKPSTFNNNNNNKRISQPLLCNKQSRLRFQSPPHIAQEQWEEQNTAINKIK